MEPKPVLPEPRDHLWLTIALIVLTMALVYFGLAPPESNAPQATAEPVPVSGPQT